MRRRRVGDIVTYVVNRNINFTNVCIKRCGFCAFSRDHREEEGYFLPVNEVIRRAKEAWDLGATEVCVQAGLPPQMEGDLYIKLCETIKSELPEIHVPRLLSRGGPVRLGAVEMLHQGLPHRAEGRRRGQPTRDLCGDTGPGDAGPHIPWPHHRRPVGRGHHHGPRAGHPHHLHHHVRPRRDPGAHRPAHRQDTGYSEGHGRIHRVRTPELRLLRGSHVQQEPCGQCAHGVPPATTYSRCTQYPG